MENLNFCEETEIEWESILQQLPDSPGICLDDFLFEEFATDILLPSLDRDNNGAFQSGIEAASNEGSVGLQLSALNDILFSDKDFENFPAGNEVGGFIDISSFLADIACAAPQQGRHVDRSHDVDRTAQIQVGNHVETSDDVDTGKNEGQILRTKEEDEEEDAFTRKRKRNRELAAKSRERKKAYEKTLQAKCLVLEGKCRKLEQSLSYCSVENATLRHELIRMKEPKPKLHCHGGGAEPAALFKDSLQMESLLCNVIMLVWVVTMIFLLPPAAPLKTAVAVVVAAAILGKSQICNQNNVVRFGVCRRKRWRWNRKNMKWKFRKKIIFFWMIFDIFRSILLGYG